MAEDDEPGPLDAAGVNSVVELMIVLTEAVKTRDLEKVLVLRRRTQDWLQMDDERDAQADLLDAVTELIADLEAYEGQEVALDAHDPGRFEA